ncbi:hypothetical protein CO2235_200141 [Cupriavidus oxalaticus]|uniref:Uncharacterized protein n=1 Tax=Cupriavidus oxalaticus TaxID=96344 RepID=A0A375FW79_9BURK|nr:hypothetical protein CO2235_U850023 [Cupriavidus oxalaticus]SPC14285.1 hypothetical protein CO2235_200141 [Cupriavidus oxalaticus]
MHKMDDDVDAIKHPIKIGIVVEIANDILDTIG